MDRKAVDLKQHYAVRLFKEDKISFSPSGLIGDTKQKP